MKNTGCWMICLRIASWTEEGAITRTGKVDDAIPDATTRDGAANE
ncbi:MAG: hypothetical protein U1E27_07825 [Kiritimatiellia bacterium]|nr:hypothetical protein [Kiritimatiellia bacterium]